MTKKTVTHTPEPKTMFGPEGSSTIEEWEKRRLMSHDELVELGLLDRDHLVFSMGPSRRRKKPATLKERGLLDRPDPVVSSKPAGRTK